jgi:hypothetical protein
MGRIEERVTLCKRSQKEKQKKAEIANLKLET